MAYTQNPLTFEVKNTAEKISPRQLDIINASGKLLTSKGSSGLTIKNLAKSMKFSEAALYRHYRSKEGIIVSMLEFLASELDNHFNAMDKSKKPNERFLDYNKCQIDYFKANPHFVTVAFSDGLFDSTDKINNAIAGVGTVLQKHLIPIIMDGKLDNTFPMEVHSEKIVHILLATSKLHMSKWRLSNYTSDLERTGMDMSETMLNIFKKN
jgi:TetR/AcrR family fatty acid metabolism transcriptional regulator|tara:strand:+ start:112106 stop:112735 length:630 start_codon:yes stop_codon:yes gene_type:complete